MKKINIYAIIYLLFSCFFLQSCNQKNNEQNLDIQKKEAKLSKEGRIQEMVDYQRDIRKGVNDTKSTYEKGYLIKEFNKAKQKNVANRSSSRITPIFKERGPANVPGRSRAIAIDPNNEDRWFIGSAGGGVWLTEDAGTTWVNLTDFKIPNLVTSALVMSQTDSKILYVGTGESFTGTAGSGVFKTVDGGTTWQSVTSTPSFGAVNRMIINPEDDKQVLIATTEGIYRTIDGGLSWSQVYTGGNVEDLDVDPSNFNIQYGSVNKIGLVKSTNAGITWSLVFDIAVVNVKHNRIETDVSKANTSVIVLSVHSYEGTVSCCNDLYVSRDAGATFINLTATAGALQLRTNLLWGQGWYDNIVLAHPFNENIFYVGGVILFKVTINNDNSFTAKEIAGSAGGYGLNVANRNVHVDNHGLFAIKGSNNEFQLVLSNDGGVYFSNFDADPGVNEGNWSNSVIGKNSTQFYGIAKQNGSDNYLGGTQDNGSWVSNEGNSDKNKSYSVVGSGDGFEAIWHYDKPGDFLVTLYENTVYKYTNYEFESSEFVFDVDGGDDAPFYTKLSNSDNNPNTVFSISSFGVWRSIDFGTTWDLTPINNLDGGSSLNVKVSTADPNIIWAGSTVRDDGNRTLHVSQDNGRSFTKTAAYVNPNDDHNFWISGMATSFISKNRAYVLFSAQGVPKILKTEDLGDTWSDITGFETGTDTGFPDVAVHSVLEMPFDKDIIWAGTDIGIFETENGGVSWNLVSDIPSVAIYDMKVVNDQVVIGTHGRGIWSATISELNTYTMPSFLVSAKATTQQKEIGSTKTAVSYSVPTNNINKIKLFVDDVLEYEIIQDFRTGSNYTYEIEGLTGGYHQLRIHIFDSASGQENIGNNQEFAVIDFDTADTSIEISQFQPSDVFAYKDAFAINNLDGKVSDVVLSNAQHPAERQESILMLKKPLILSEANKNLTYEDFLLVESNPSEDLTTFWNYLLIEASSDLTTWKTIDKYDSRRFPEWTEEALKEPDAVVNDALFRSQNISLTDKGFAFGDAIVFRFTLKANIPNQFSKGDYGWAIKSLKTEIFLGLPEISMHQKDMESTKTAVNYILPTDGVNRVKVFIDGDLQDEIIQDFSAGVSYTYETTALTGGYHELRMDIFDDVNGQENIGNPQEFVVIDFEAANTSIEISQFQASDVFAYKNAFAINNLDGKVSGDVLSNQHPSSLEESVVVLKKPLILSETNKNLTYEDFLLVESNTDEDLNVFWRYLLIEASSDLTTWKTIDKYDSRRFPKWTEESLKKEGAVINDALFREQNTLLTDKGFAIGDAIVFRFTLYAAPTSKNDQGDYGWAMKSLKTSANYLNSAEVSSHQKNIESTKTIVNYALPNSSVSRIKIFIDGNLQNEITQDFNAGVPYTYETENLTEGYHKLRIQIFDDKNGQENYGNSQEFLVIDFVPVATSIEIIEFSDSDIFAYQGDFVIDDLGGNFSGNVLSNSEHPYLNNSNSSVILKKPLTISDSNKFLNYEDLVIIQPGEGDDHSCCFWDYVIIEASSDLVTWKTIDKYDSRRFSEWEIAYNNGATSSVDEDLFKVQRVALTDNGFAIGDTIVLRFRLKSDANNNSFGWAIKSLNTDSATASIDDVTKGIKTFKIYPTVSDGNFTILARNAKVNVKLVVFDVFGKQVYSSKLDFNSNEKQLINLDISSGAYIIQLIDDNGNKFSNKVIIE